MAVGYLGASRVSSLALTKIQLIFFLNIQNDGPGLMCQIGLINKFFTYLHNSFQMKLTIFFIYLISSYISVATFHFPKIYQKSFNITSQDFYVEVFEGEENSTKSSISTDLYQGRNSYRLFKSQDPHQAYCYYPSMMDWTKKQQ